MQSNAIKGKKLVGLEFNSNYPPSFLFLLKNILGKGYFLQAHFKNEYFKRMKPYVVENVSLCSVRCQEVRSKGLKV